MTIWINCDVVVLYIVQSCGVQTTKHDTNDYHYAVTLVDKATHSAVINRKLKRKSNSSVASLYMRGRRGLHGCGHAPCTGRIEVIEVRPVDYRDVVGSEVNISGTSVRANWIGFDDTIATSRRTPKPQIHTQKAESCYRERQGRR